LNGHWSATQCATVFPVPGDATKKKYYLITSPLTGTATRIQYNIVDLDPATNGGFATGRVVTKNVIMPGSGQYMMEALVSCPHYNGTDVWVIGHEASDPNTDAGGDKFYVWLVTNSGITLSNTYTLGYDYPRDPTGPSSRGIGIMKFNSCFNRLFISYYNASSRVEGFQFSNSTGVISNWPAPVSAPLLLDDYRNTAGTMTAFGSFAYGIEISPNGRYLYVTKSGETGSREIVQYDLQAATGTNAAIENSCVNLTPAVPDGVRYGMLQLGPDGKIYHTLHQWNAIGSGGYCKISVINSPNSAGAAANYVEGAYTWPVTATGVGSTMGLPSFHKGFLAGVAQIKPGAGITSLDAVCVGQPAGFEANYTQNGTNWRWNIDANLNAVNDYFTQNITHTYSTAGNYTVTLTLDDATCGYTVTETSRITVNPVVNSAGTISCNPPRGNVTSPNGAYTYVWYADAAGTQPIATGTTNVNLPIAGSGNVYLKAQSSVSTTSGSNTVLGPANTITGWQNPASTNTLNFTVNNVVTINSFQWGNGLITWGTTDNRIYNVKITNSANTLTYYDQNFTVDVYNSVKTVTTSPAVTLSPGTYRIVITGPSNPNLWNNLTPTSQADNSLVVTSGAGMIGNLNYSYINYSVTSLPCSNMATIPFNCPLPVSWLDFTATRTPSGNLLNWSTSKEENNHYFIIERSYDGINFEAIGQISGAGNSSSNIFYSFLDNQASSGITYYRIKQVDIDGKYSYSPVRSVYSEGFSSVSVYPNPNNGIFNLKYHGGEGEIEIVIYNNLGQKVHQQILEGSGEFNEAEINLSSLVKGVYHLSAEKRILKIVIE
jgi:hypothetical protein